MSLITLTFVTMGILNGFVRQKKFLFTTTDFHFFFILLQTSLNSQLFIHYIFVVYRWRVTWNLILIIYVDILKLFVRIHEAEGKIAKRNKINQKSHCLSFGTTDILEHWWFDW